MSTSLCGSTRIYKQLSMYAILVNLRFQKLRQRPLNLQRLFLTTTEAKHTIPKGFLRDVSDKEKYYCAGTCRHGEPRTYSYRFRGQVNLRAREERRVSGQCLTCFLIVPFHNLIMVHSALVIYFKTCTCKRNGIL